MTARARSASPITASPSCWHPSPVASAIPGERFLGYVRGGAAWERDEYWATTIVLGTAYTARVTRPGWTIGVGGEYAFTRILSGFIEYDYYDFGTRQITFTPQVIGLNPAFVDIKDTTSVVRAGLNVRFGGYAANY